MNCWIINDLLKVLIESVNHWYHFMDKDTLGSGKSLGDTGKKLDKGVSKTNKLKNNISEAEGVPREQVASVLGFSILLLSLYTCRDHNGHMRHLN